VVTTSVTTLPENVWRRRLKSQFRCSTTSLLTPVLKLKGGGQRLEGGFALDSSSADPARSAVASPSSGVAEQLHFHTDTSVDVRQPLFRSPCQPTYKWQTLTTVTGFNSSSLAAVGVGRRSTPPSVSIINAISPCQVAHQAGSWAVLTDTYLWPSWQTRFPIEAVQAVTASH
jgi:hypothetical protein